MHLTQLCNRAIEMVKCVTKNVTYLNIENKKIKETVIDLQARGMRDNLVFSGIPEAAGEDSETTVKSLIKTHLKLPLTLMTLADFLSSLYKC